MSSFPDAYCIVDTETTGMKPPYARIIDIGIIRVEKGREVERYQTLINPETRLPPFIRRMTSITDEVLSRAPTFDEVAIDIERLLRDAVFVAHNVAFDYNFVRSEFKRLKMNFAARTLCSAQLSRTLFPEYRAHNLDAILQRYSLHCTDRHRALPDADVVLQFFRHIESTIDSREIQSALEKKLGTSALQKSAIKELPDNPGVYFFYGADNELLYVGKSKHIRTRARSHFGTVSTQRARLMQTETSAIHSRQTSGELSALLLESSLIKQESPLYNRALRKFRKLSVVFLENDPSGYYKVKVQWVDTLTPDSRMLGVFRSDSQAKNTLRNYASKYSLCLKVLGLEKGEGECFAYQLGRCTGACVRAVLAEQHNELLLQAFAKRRVQSWPYKRGIVIDEKSSDTGGTAFYVNQWIILKSFTYEQDERTPFLDSGTVFDYDSYKILARFLRNPNNKHLIRPLSNREMNLHIAEYDLEEIVT